VNTDYRETVYLPTTRDHYARGGYYIEAVLTTDRFSGKQYHRKIRRLTRDEALDFIGDKVRSLIIIYPEFGAI
jgi:hypothetical protein